jgi:hypothetical protein
VKARWLECRHTGSFGTRFYTALSEEPYLNTSTLARLAPVELAPGRGSRSQSCTATSLAVSLTAPCSVCVCVCVRANAVYSLCVAIEMETSRPPHCSQKSLPPLGVKAGGGCFQRRPGYGPVKNPPPPFPRRRAQRALEDDNQGAEGLVSPCERSLRFGP